MGQIVGGAAKPKRCNLNKLSQLGTPAAGEYILVSSDNSMNAAGQGNFDCYIIGDGTTAATARPLNKVENLAFDLDIQINGELHEIDFARNCQSGKAINTTSIAAGAQPFHIDAGEQATVLVELNGCIADGKLSVIFMDSAAHQKVEIKPSSGIPMTFTPSVDIEYISLYCAKTDVVATGTIRIVVQYGDNSNCIAEKVKRNSDDVQELTDGEADVVSIDYATTPNRGINTTTIATGAYPVNIPSGTECFVELTDKDNVLSNYLSISFCDANVHVIGTGLRLFKGGPQFFTPNSQVSYITAYIHPNYVGGSSPSSINVSIKYPASDLGVKDTLKIALIQARKSSNFAGETCLFIGDSVSTANNYKWKGILETNYNLKYARDISDQLAPANGGITIIPPTTEASDNANKSIWYRCAQQRMGIYTFDYISLFGGTNDMNASAHPNIELGTTNDAPYVDTLDGFSSEIAATLTATRPATLTYAAALMGCIEMLHRDFPTKKIILPTVFPCRDSYGNETDASGMRLSERMAILQMQIANKYSGGTSSASDRNYGVVAVPFYWYTRTFENSVAGAMSRDGVHPNLAQARSMAILFAENLLLSE